MATHAAALTSVSSALESFGNAGTAVTPEKLG